ncbi:MAG: hypothetical protein ACXVCP_14000 [Bdellovibrio sp.]
MDLKSAICSIISISVSLFTLNANADIPIGAVSAKIVVFENSDRTVDINNQKLSEYKIYIKGKVLKANWKLAIMDLVDYPSESWVKMNFQPKVSAIWMETSCSQLKDVEVESSALINETTGEVYLKFKGSNSLIKFKQISKVAEKSKVRILELRQHLGVFQSTRLCIGPNINNCERKPIQSGDSVVWQIDDWSASDQIELICNI